MVDYYIANPGKVTKKILNDFSIKDRREFLHYADFSNFEWLKNDDFYYYLKHNIYLQYREGKVEYECLRFETRNKIYTRDLFKHYLDICEPKELELFFPILNYILDHTQVNKELYNLIKSKKVFSEDEYFWNHLIEYRNYLNGSTLLKNVIKLYKIFPKFEYKDNLAGYIIRIALLKYQGDKLKGYNIVKHLFSREIDNWICILKNFELTEEEENKVIKHFTIKNSKSILQTAYDNCIYKKNKEYITSILFIKSVEK